MIEKVLFQRHDYFTQKFQDHVFCIIFSTPFQGLDISVIHVINKNHFGQLLPG